VKSISVLLALFILTVGNPAAAEAQEPNVLRMTLKESVSMALKQNNLVKAAGYSAEAASQGVAIANSRYYPGLFFEETFAASNAPTQTFMMKLDQGRFNQNDFLISNLNHPQSHHDFKTALTIQQPLYNPSTAPLREIAVKDAEKGGLGLEGVRQDIAFQTFRLYLEVQKAAAQLAASEQAISDARENLRLAKVRSEAGLGLRSDELRAKTHLASIEQQNITARNNLTLAQLQLANTLGLPEGSRAEIVDPPTALATPISEQEIAKTALESRIDLQQDRAELDKSETAMKLARAAYLPAVSSFASYQMNSSNTPLGNDNDAWLVGATLKWQIFDGFKRCREHDRATANLSAAGEILANRTRESNYQVTESFLRHKETNQRLAVARHALTDADETVRLLTKRFENSLATMAELLDAQTALNQVRANLVDSETNYALAGGRIYYSAGIFLKEIMK
jgi:outer membrane protein TolC